MSVVIYNNFLKPFLKTFRDPFKLLKTFSFKASKCFFWKHSEEKYTWKDSKKGQRSSNEFQKKNPWKFIEKLNPKSCFSFWTLLDWGGLCWDWAWGNWGLKGLRLGLDNNIHLCQVPLSPAAKLFRSGWLSGRHTWTRKQLELRLLQMLQRAICSDIWLFQECFICIDLSLISKCPDFHWCSLFRPEMRSHTLSPHLL